MALRDDNHPEFVIARGTFYTRICRVCGLQRDETDNRERCCPRTLEFTGPCRLCKAEPGKECLDEKTGTRMGVAIHAFGGRWDRLPPTSAAAGAGVLP